MSSLPVTLWVPPRGELPECWLAVHHILSVSYIGSSVYIEMPRSSLELIYSSSEEMQKAARCFAAAMVNEPDSEAKAAYPKPLRGDTHF